MEKQNITLDILCTFIWTQHLHKETQHKQFFLKPPGEPSGCCGGGSGGSGSGSSGGG